MVLFPACPVRLNRTPGGVRIPSGQKGNRVHSRRLSKKIGQTFAFLAGGRGVRPLKGIERGLDRQITETPIAMAPGHGQGPIRIIERPVEKDVVHDQDEAVRLRLGGHPAHGGCRIRLHPTQENKDREVQIANRQLHRHDLVHRRRHRSNRHRGGGLGHPRMPRHHGFERKDSIDLRPEVIR